jgi:DNA-binding LytR/AlgR family response regulator
MPLRTVIVEDETPSRERLKSMLSEFEEIELVGEAKDGPDGVKLINQQKPDLAFLDIQLPVFTSFEILEKITHKPHIIFITAYDEYAIKAFEANAVDYLLKPTTPERLRDAINRVRQRSPQNQDLLSVIQTIIAKNQFRKRFTVKIGDEILFIPADDIYWFHADDKYVFLHTSQKQYLVDDTLKNLEVSLDPSLFIRIHKSVIINTEKLHRVKRDFIGHYKVQLIDLKKSTFKIGQTYLSTVREKLQF